MKNLAISPADLAALAKVAKEYGVVVEQEVEGGTFRVRPTAGPPSAKFNDCQYFCDRLEPIRPPLEYREMFTLKVLVEIGVGQIAYSSLIRWCDLATVKKLSARGYIVAKPPGRKLSDDEIRLTSEGLAAWEVLQEFRQYR